MRRRRRDENGFGKPEERRSEKSRGGFVGVVDTMGSLAASSDQLKRPKTRDSGGFWVKIGEISMFCCFFMKLTVAECKSRFVTMEVGAGSVLTSSAHLDWPETVGSGFI